jgi:hypothetical protein
MPIKGIIKVDIITEESEVRSQESEWKIEKFISA